MRAPPRFHCGLFAPSLFVARLPGAAAAARPGRLDPGAAAVQSIPRHGQDHTRHPGA